MKIINLWEIWVFLVLIMFILVGTGYYLKESYKLQRYDFCTKYPDYVIDSDKLCSDIIKGENK